jgi:hypothetical protein
MFKRNKNSAVKKDDKPKIKIKVNRSSGTFAKGVSRKYSIAIANIVVGYC